MPILETSAERLQQIKSGSLSTDIRERAHNLCKDFKTSWLQLGQTLFTIHRDKLYYGWGYEKFEDYTKRELGFKKQVAMKMLKSYLFLEQDEPEYLEKNFAEMRESPRVPSLDEVNVLRLAKGKRELGRDDYLKLKKGIFEKGKDASVVRKELTALIKERKPVDPEKEREDRNISSIKKMINSLRSFQKDMEALKMVPHEILEEAKVLMDKLNEQI